MKKNIKILLFLIAAFGIIQLVPIDRNNPPVKAEENFVHIMQTPQNITKVLKNSCYDCHSNETIYPSYAYIAPISWAIKHNINKGREHLNFSKWGSYNSDLKTSMLKNAVSDIQEHRMPHSGYLAQRPEARLSAIEKKQLVEYFEAILKQEQKK